MKKDSFKMIARRRRNKGKPTIIKKDCIIQVEPLILVVSTLFCFPFSAFPIPLFCAHLAVLLATNTVLLPSRPRCPLACPSATSRSVSTVTRAVMRMKLGGYTRRSCCIHSQCSSHCSLCRRRSRCRAPLSARRVCVDRGVKGGGTGQAGGQVVEGFANGA